MEIFIKVVQLLLSLSILVLLHELGHFIPAKLFKTRVEKFYLFFDPWFHLFRIKFRGTEYGVGWLPLGGYCKIAGMIDESMDKEQMKQAPKSDEFRAKPSWQRLIIMLGGVTMNVILAIGIYIVMLNIYGEEYLPTRNVSTGIAVDSLGRQLGLKDGDKILSLDNKYIEDFSNVPVKIILDNPKTIEVERDGKVQTINVPDGAVNNIIKNNSAKFISLRVPFYVEDFPKHSPARDAGIMKNDRIIGLNDVATPWFHEFKEEIAKHKNETVTVVALRNNDTLKIPVKVSEQGLIGVNSLGSLKKYFSLEKREYNIVEAIPAGTVKAFKGIGDYVKQLKLIFSPETKAYESIGGFIAIGNIFPSEWNWQDFWRLTAFLSIILAVMNVLPIPALDGGHVLFLFYEIITGRKPSDKFLEYAQVAGMVILFSLLIFANANDIIKLFR